MRLPSSPSTCLQGVWVKGTLPKRYLRWISCVHLHHQLCQIASAPSPRPGPSRSNYCLILLYTSHKADRSVRTNACTSTSSPRRSSQSGGAAGVFDILVIGPRGSNVPHGAVSVPGRVQSCTPNPQFWGPPACFICVHPNTLGLLLSSQNSTALARLPTNLTSILTRFNSPFWFFDTTRTIAHTSSSTLCPLV